mgnify:CR=1 FL=1
MNPILTKCSVEQLKRFLEVITDNNMTDVYLENQLFSKTQLRQAINEKEENVDTD